ncbi:hypothetical protein BCL93_102229 [Onishia taeanensis]|uniref:Uncharacterized protein n=1 Tax=Onishia taeanensis TaxID=284577 RepID=A0A328XW55_9GAMM|nr:hypothetical protein [Halomonas taeanensis]RAR63490.1 hypothetical protein BCL93_102229 [Halomonas taeanensis]
MKGKTVKSTPLTHFQRQASAEQKKALHAKVISNAIARQKQVINQASERR